MPRILSTIVAGLLALSGSGTVGAVSYSPGCLASPYPASPQGSVVAEGVATEILYSTRYLVWRRACQEGIDPMILLTLEPVSGTPSVAGVVDLIQGGRQFHGTFYETINEAGVPQSAFGFSLQVPRTVGIRIDESVASFDASAPFEIRRSYVNPQGQQVNLSLPVPAFSVTPGDGLRPFSGELSGAWFDPAREGEGVLLEFGRSGQTRTASVAWYTWSSANDGRATWLVGAAEYTPGSTAATVTLFEASGARFGAEFRSADVQLAVWGEATIEFAGCNALGFRWRRVDGATGDYAYQRITAGLDGAACE